MIRTICTVVGFFLVGVATADATSTLVATRPTKSRYWPSKYFYSFTWLLVGKAFRRISSMGRRETILALFGPLSVLGLLVMWVATSIFGWALVWWGMRGGFHTPLQDFGDAWYYSGVTYFTVGFGDYLSATGFTRFFTLVEAFTGMITTAMVIGYLPALYSAYSARERQLLRLDDFSGGRISPISLVIHHIDGDDTTALRNFFSEWEAWCCEVAESHTSYPMLGSFRSQRFGQSWVTALGVVVDAAVVYLGAVDDDHTREAEGLFRQGCYLADSIARLFSVEPKELPEVPRDLFQKGYDDLRNAGIPLKDPETSLSEVIRLRRQFNPNLEKLIDATLAPRGFWAYPVGLSCVQNRDIYEDYFENIERVEDAEIKGELPQEVL